MIDLKLDDVSKRYLLREASGQPSRLWKGARKRSAEMWALQNVSFEVRRGETLGIVGHNGAGKSTILKLLSRITAPTRGQITISGRLVALIEVGSGFHPELTGRENVYLHGAMLGMRRAEIARKMASIIDFSGLEKYIDVPVKRYSSGMYIRLGFSVAAHLDPDIVLLDEVLAVGDAAFQAKCLDRISALRKSGRTIVFVSHDLASVYRLCDRAILLDRGRVLMDGAPRVVVDEYMKVAFGDKGESAEEAYDGEKPAQCLGVSFAGSDFNAAVRTGHPMVARVRYHAATHVPNVVFRLSIYWPSGYLCAQLTNETSGPPLDLQPGTGAIEFRCPVVPVVPGLYRVDIGIETSGRELDLRQRCATLCVETGEVVAGDFYIQNAWTIQNDVQHLDDADSLQKNQARR